MFIGALSYSIYVVHEIVIAALHDHVPAGHIERGALYVVVTLLFCWGVYRLVERPFAKLRRKLSRTGPLPTALPMPPQPEPVRDSTVEPAQVTSQPEPVRDNTVEPALVMSGGTGAQSLVVVGRQSADAADVVALTPPVGGLTEV